MRQHLMTRRQLHGLLNARPTLGGLMELCEGNYRLLNRLVPDMTTVRGSQISRRQGSPALHLDVLEQARHTSLLRLTYHFDSAEPAGHDPDMRLRVYHDARQVEVESLHQTALPLDRLYQHPALDQKWRANQFLSRWLSFCLMQGHAFRGAPRPSNIRAKPLVAA